MQLNISVNSSPEIFINYEMMNPVGVAAATFQIINYPNKNQQQLGILLIISALTRQLLRTSSQNIRNYQENLVFLEFVCTVYPGSKSQQQQWLLLGVMLTNVQVSRDRRCPLR